MRAALRDADGLVVNVIVYDPEADYEPPWGLTLDPLPDGSPVSIGWRHLDGEYTPPPTESLGVAPLEVPVGEVATATYTNTFPEAPASVVFTVNGVTAEVALTDGIAELDVTVAEAGPVTISVDREYLLPVTVQGV